MVKAEGVRKIEAVLLESDAGGGEHRLECGFLCLAPNPDPVTALLSHADAKLTYDETLGASVPASLPDSIYAAGDVTGIHDAEINLLQGRIAGLEAASASGAGKTDSEALSSLKAELDHCEKAYREEISSTSLHVTGEIFGKKAARTKKFVCICEDVTEKDVRQAIDEGFADVQSLKRYSTVSMGPCQGKMCHKSYHQGHLSSHGPQPRRRGWDDLPPSLPTHTPRRNSRAGAHALQDDSHPLRSRQGRR